ncbi:bbp45 domain protein [Burkholderia pseudomallei]|uniref:hypothetical protein n=1 Tax=Burkholderia pseudomallei TaxID=28450 RepID=UPI00050F766B|nr:hypothetical protein [Burkholderia pseudomallei]KGC71040.1 bbp45 domain protein [Burkholderia pseudomallei]
MYREDDIVHENGKAWVLRDRPQKVYAVCVSGTTHSTVDSAYELNPDGLSIAIARCDYVANRIAQKQGVWSASIEPTNIVATDEAFPACVWSSFVPDGDARGPCARTVRPRGMREAIPRV